MLVQSFRNADHEWAIDESLVAACTLCDKKAGRIALVRHGMLKAVQRSMQMSLASDLVKSVDNDTNLPPFVLSREAQALCAQLLAAFSKCKASRGALSEKPETALVIINALRSQTLLCLIQAVKMLYYKVPRWSEHSLVMIGFSWLRS